MAKVCVCVCEGVCVCVLLRGFHWSKEINDNCVQLHMLNTSKEACFKLV